MATGWRSEIVLRQGDLTEADTDAIVNAANNDLHLGAGVAGDPQGWPLNPGRMRPYGPIALGEAAITGGGKLKVRFVVHAASMRLGGVTSEATQRRATRNALKRAVENKLRSIAFPAIGTGIAGFPMRRCAEVMLDEIRDHLKSRTSLHKVEMVLFDKAALDEFELAFAALPD